MIGSVKTEPLISSTPQAIRCKRESNLRWLGKLNCKIVMIVEKESYLRSRHTSWKKMNEDSPSISVISMFMIRHNYNGLHLGHMLQNTSLKCIQRKKPQTFPFRMIVILKSKKIFLQLKRQQSREKLLKK